MTGLLKIKRPSQFYLIKPYPMQIRKFLFCIGLSFMHDVIKTFLLYSIELYIISWTWNTILR